MTQSSSHANQIDAMNNNNCNNWKGTNYTKLQRGNRNNIFLISLLFFLQFISLNNNENTVRAWFYKAPTILDADLATFNIEDIAREMCNTQASFETQISRISTVYKLADYFRQLPADHKLAACGRLYANSIESLSDLLRLSLANVCSDEKVSAIREYHLNFISSAPLDLLDRPAGGEGEGDEQQEQQWQQPLVPRMLNIFFKHYAMEVSAICKRSLINNLEWSLKDKFTEEDFEFAGRGRLDMIVTNLNYLFYSDAATVNDFDDVILVGDFVRGQVVGVDMEQIADEGVDEETGEEVKLLVKIKNNEALNVMRRKCHYKFKPVYEKLIMPIVRLADLGYSNTGSQFERELLELRNNKLVKLWYGVTQICDAILPIQFFEDPTLDTHDTVVLTREEAQKLLSEEREKKGKERGEKQQALEVKHIDFELTTNSMQGIDKLESVESVEVQILVKYIKTNVSTRTRALQRALSQILKRIKQNAVSLLFSRKVKTCPQSSGLTSKSIGSPVCSKNGFIKESLQEELAAMSEEDLLNLEGGFGRPRRGIQRNKGRVRAMDRQQLLERVSSQISYKHTKSWSQIFESITSRFKISKWNTVIACMVLISIFLAFMAFHIG